MLCAVTTPPHGTQQRPWVEGSALAADLSGQVGCFWKQGLGSCVFRGTRLSGELPQVLLRRLQGKMQALLSPAVMGDAPPGFPAEGSPGPSKPRPKATPALNVLRVETGRGCPDSAPPPRAQQAPLLGGLCSASWEEETWSGVNPPPGPQSNWRRHKERCLHMSVVLPNAAWHVLGRVTHTASHHRPWQRLADEI